ncbi:MAG: hypothetical protein LBT99_01980 [Bifidobacteriaceae bacterium]|jgi:hypothetical protein|nr:hypothetical protein [Bifidobacteriaceae bacterium]
MKKINSLFLVIVAGLAMMVGSLFVSPQPAQASSLFSAGYSNLSWYDNTGTTLPQVPNYSKYDLLNKVQPGDVIFEGTGFGGLTGHILTVEGIFHDPTLDKDYIRIIESSMFLSHSHFVADGVVRGVLDDQRVDDNKISIYRDPNATFSQGVAVANFEVSQLGKPYTFKYFSYSNSPNTKKWYCSELAWAAWESQGIDIENHAWNRLPGLISPRDVTIYSPNMKLIFKGDKA